VGTFTFEGASIRDDIRNFDLCDFNTLFAQFKDPNDNLVNVVSGKVDIWSARYDPSDPSGRVVSGASIFNFTTGTYGYVVNPELLEPGYYSVRFSGTLITGETGVPVTGYSNITLPQALCVEGQIQVLERTLEMDMTLRVRRRLKDLNTRLYQIDLPVRKWQDDEILDVIFKAVGEINVTPPMATNYTLRTLPSGVEAYVIDMAYADCLESQAVFENANTLTMSDGSANLSLSRAQTYATIAASARTRVDQKLAKWKRSLVPKLYGQGTNQYPFHLRHMISYIPGHEIFGP
jgi:hypothetical protein